MKYYIKELVERIPYSVGKHLAKIPFDLRLGKEYTQFRNFVNNDYDEEYILKYSLTKLSSIFNYAKEKISFYNTLYKDAGVYDLKINSIEDFKCLPIVTKDLIREHIDDFSGYLKLNTGGTRGKPFSFYVDKQAFAREWAHMHKIWAFRNYDYKKVKITLRGKNLGDKYIVYNPVHNEFILNTYKSILDYKNELLSLCKSVKIEYLHGYPSAIYSFLKTIDEHFSNDEKCIVKKNIKALLLGSEFPVPYMVDYINKYWKIDYVSWYGHSEMCILAVDKENSNDYFPFFSYGFSEVENNHLIGTSFHNFDMPLIRYDTSDIVKPDYYENGMVKSFEITEGRSGDYLIDKDDNKIPITAFIFGRHHRVFDYIDNIQLKQNSPGKVTLYISTTKKITKERILTNMDLSNVRIDFDIRIIEKPILTKSGKFSILIV